MHQSIEVLSKDCKSFRRIIITSTSEGEMSIHTPEGPVEGAIGEWLYNAVQRFFEERVKAHEKEHSVDYGLFRRYDWETRILDEE